MTATAALAYIAAISLMTFMGINANIKKNPMLGIEAIDKQVFLLITAVIFTVGVLLSALWQAIF